MKKCPYCAEMIQDEAIVCPHCQKDLSKTQQVAKGLQQLGGSLTLIGCSIMALITICIVFYVVYNLIAH